MIDNLHIKYKHSDHIFFAEFWGAGAFRLAWGFCLQCLVKQGKWIAPNLVLTFCIHYDINLPRFFLDHTMQKNGVRVCGSMSARLSGSLNGYMAKVVGGSPVDFVGQRLPYINL